MQNILSNLATSFPKTFASDILGDILETGLYVYVYLKRKCYISFPKCLHMLRGILLSTTMSAFPTLFIEYWLTYEQGQINQNLAVLWPRWRSFLLFEAQVCLHMQTYSQHVFVSFSSSLEPTFPYLSLTSSARKVDRLCRRCELGGVTGREQGFTSLPSSWSTNDQEEACRGQ